MDRPNTLSTTPVPTRQPSRAGLRHAPLIAALWLAGCVSLPAIDPQTMPATPAAFAAGDGRWTNTRTAPAPAQGAWWKAFSDPVLDELVERAQRQNTDVQVAAARLAQARALLGSARADRLPQLGVSTGASRGTEAGAGPAAATLYNAGASLSYEADLFGRLSRGVDAAQLDTRSREALLQGTRLLVQADVAQAYFALRAIDTEQALVRDTVEAYRDTLLLTERRYNAGDIAELDVARVRTEVAATESDALALERRRTAMVHALAVLVGETASSFQVQPASDWSGAVLPVVPAGVPGTVLTRRPDVAAASSALLAAQARVGVAQAAWFPNVSLTASAGYASPELADVFKWSARAWGVGALLSLPVFDGGRREAGIQVARAEFDARSAEYRAQVLQALRDVEDGLSALTLLGRQAEAQRRAVDSSSRATALSDSRYRNGYVSQLDLLDARRSELGNRRVAIQVQAAQYQATVGLIKALGGGWESAPG